MHILFAHGVATRRTSDYEAHVAVRHKAFTEHMLAGRTATFFDPYWGDLGASPDREFKSIPYKPGTALGIGGPGEGPIAPEERLAEHALLDAARVDFAGLLNSLSITLVVAGDPQAERLAGAIGIYAAALDRGDERGVAAPAWFADLNTDAEFLERLGREVEPAEAATTLGLGDWLKRAGRQMLGIGIDLADGPAARLVRGFTPHVARFIGDVFIYLRDGDRRRRIRQIVIDDLVRAARSARERREPLVLVGHSMGAIILYDILGDPTAILEINAAVGAPLQVDLLLTVGTQIGLFEELGLFEGERLGGPAGAPSCTRLWWHVFNQMDVLSFGVEGVVAGASQFSIDTQANIVDAHTAYFISPVFYHRLRKRMVRAALLG